MSYKQFKLGWEANSILVVKRPFGLFYIIIVMLFSDFGLNYLIIYNGRQSMLQIPPVQFSNQKV